MISSHILVFFKTESLLIHFAFAVVEKGSPVALAGLRLTIELTLILNFCPSPHHLLSAGWDYWGLLVWTPMLSFIG